MFTLNDLERNFPHRSLRANQREALQILSERAKMERSRSVTFEMPTGSGKTAVGIAFLKTLQEKGKGPLFFVVPTKTQVDQVKRLHPEVRIAYGRHEYPCLFYEDPASLTRDRVKELFADPKNFKADEIPCLKLDCPHRVNQVTGETQEPGVPPCPYYQAKWEAKSNGGIIVCTTAFYLFTQLFSKEWDTPAGLVFDEAHNLADIVRNCLSYEVTDYHLARCIELLKRIGAEEAKALRGFRLRMVRIIRRKPPKERNILTEEEVESLLEALLKIDIHKLDKRIQDAVRRGEIDAREDRETLTKLDNVIHDLHHYVTALRLSLATEERSPLSYIYCYYTKEKEEGKRVQYRLYIKSYYVIPLIRKLLSPFTVCVSATIGDPEVFGFETGIKSPCFTFPSDFPAAHTRIFMPTDTPDLSLKARRMRRQSMTRTLRQVAKACLRFARQGHRSLVVVVSNAEREKFIMLAAEEGVNAVSYGNGVSPKKAAQGFKEGEGDVLVGTAANYGEGVDLPRRIAPVIFFLRPGYPNPTDPGSIFEERRFGKRIWALWNWRVMIEALQVRGRNIRNARDVGVTIFVSQQFRRFLYPSLPAWLKDAYVGNRTLDDCVGEALSLLDGTLSAAER